MHEVITLLVRDLYEAREDVPANVDRISDGSRCRHYRKGLYPIWTGPRFAVPIHLDIQIQYLPAECHLKFFELI
jgi:hypothetical protein